MPSAEVQQIARRASQLATRCDAYPWRGRIRRGDPHWGNQAAACYRVIDQLQTDSIPPCVAQQRLNRIEQRLDDAD